MDEKINYYENADKENKVPNNENNKKYFFNRKKLIIVIAVVFVFFMVFLLFNGCSQGDNSNKENAIVELMYAELDLVVGKNVKLKYNVKNVNDSLKIKWSSENNEIATVNDEGIVTGVKVGKTIITASYVSNNEIKEAKCAVTVLKDDNDKPSTSKPNNNDNNNSNNNTNNNTNIPPKDTVNPTLKVNYAVGNKDNWNNKNVELEVLASDNSNKVNVKYVLNCTSNCKYAELTSNKIVVSTEGSNVVTVVATDASNNTTKVEVPVKIDKALPSISLEEKIASVVYDNTGTKEICATCADSRSGCKEEKVCKKFTATTKNVVIEVYDKAGNKATTQSFDVIVDKTKPTCSLKVSSSGKLSATSNDKGGSELAYYGFSSKYSGTKSSSMTVGTGTYTYYVKDKAGNKNTCKLTVKSRSVNCVCPSGYAVLSEVSSTKCSKWKESASWSDTWTYSKTEEVASCSSLNTCSTSTINTCYKCVENQANGRYVKTIYTRKRNKCPSGTTHYNANCYYVKSKTCNTEYYS